MADWSHSILFRAIRGAVKNALDGHPEWRVPHGFARSVAKRAAGTLAGLVPEAALAAARRSGKRNALRSKGVVRGRSPSLRAAALTTFKRDLDALATAAHKDGDQGRFLDLCTASRIVEREIARLTLETDASTQAQDKETRT